MMLPLNEEAMQNFDYLKEIPYLSDLYAYCHTAEITQRTNPGASALSGRQALEWLVRAIYQMKNIEVDTSRKRASLFELVDGEPFKDFVENDRLMMAVHYIRKVGNCAAHLGMVTPKESFFSLLNLYNFVGAVLVKLQVVPDFPAFRKELIPDDTVVYKVSKELPQPDAVFVEHIDTEKIKKEPVETRPTELTEAETRQYFIDMMLREAGWEAVKKRGAISPLKACIEVEVQGMPNESGTGYADYVLFGADGKPLAVIEAKRTSADKEKGRKQAALYADCLEQRYGIRPVIYCTNGYHTEVLDGLGYPYRDVYGFHTVKDLELLIQLRNRRLITDLRINDSITDREYQKRAIRQVCERFNRYHRRTLLVMATGTGKTRVAISLTDVLMRNGWVKNVLFLADRTALVRQAKKNFVKLLPSVTTCVLSEDKKPDKLARVMFSTYQTMINYIDKETKDFSVGRFDLVIIDEAHRSVFGKYTAIFDYFDSLLVGLTATPRDEVERNTFDLFQIDAEDTFAYELDEAVDDGYLVPYNPLRRGTSILDEGIVYDKLDSEEKEQLETVWKYEKARNGLDDAIDYHRDIESREIFKYIFNKGTIDKVLQNLMNDGLRVKSGECVGKSIIFAYNHQHAVLIVERFHVLYPEYGADFCVLIDNYVNYAQSLIDNFEVRDKLPQIAVSVDMLDTGIDVPDILNLVFFKPVRSKIKFMQMIGRGTRLSPDIFGPGEDKKHFNIFDWCGNFDYFSINEKGQEPLPVQSLTEKLFCIRLDIAFALQRAVYQQDTFDKNLHDDLKEGLLQEVMSLKDIRIDVRARWETVDRFRKAESWVCLDAVSVNQLKEEIAPLLVKSVSDEQTKRFDLIMLQIELSQIDENVDSLRQQQEVMHICEQLQEKASIPQVLAKMKLIQDMLVPEYWQELTLERLEYVRKELRELVKFIVREKGRTFTLNIEDELIGSEESVPYLRTPSYRQRVMDYLARNKDLPVIQKIIHIEQLNHADIRELERIFWKELGTKEDYERYIRNGNLLCGDSVAAFIRSQVGIDRKEALHKFSEFLSGHVLTSEQEEYLKTIITYVCKNGDITAESIVNEPPFDEFDWLDIFGDDFVNIRKYVEKLHNTIVA